MLESKKIGLGTVQFGLPYGISNNVGQTPASEVASILEFARQNGIGMLDCASAYGNAEEILGKNNLRPFQVVSKFMPPEPGMTVTTKLRKSLEKLRLSTLYAYLAHRPLDLVKAPSQWKELKVLKEKGKIEKIGFSLNDPDDLDILLAKGFVPDLIQVPYNYFDRRFEGMMLQLKSGGCEVHTRSTFLQGLFFMKPDELETFFDDVKPVLHELQEDKKSLPGRLLRFAIEKPFIDKVIIGVENKEQLSQNLEDIGNSGKLPELKQQLSNIILTPSRWPQK